MARHHEKGGQMLFLLLLWADRLFSETWQDIVEEGETQNICRQDVTWSASGSYDSDIGVNYHGESKNEGTNLYLSG